jgi:hypothetical protein
MVGRRCQAFGWRCRGSELLRYGEDSGRQATVERAQAEVAEALEERFQRRDALGVPVARPPGMDCSERRADQLVQDPRPRA